MVCFKKKSSLPFRIRSVHACADPKSWNPGKSPLAADAEYRDTVLLFNTL